MGVAGTNIADATFIADLVVQVPYMFLMAAAACMPSAYLVLDFNMDYAPQMILVVAMTL